MISIIIPTLNEEKYLPKLLESIKKQNFKDYEVIVSDNSSKDKTRQIAKKFKCKIVKGGLPGKGRNNGAKVAKGEIIMFLDGDCIIKKDFLEKALSEIKKRKLDVTACNLWPLSKKISDNIAYALYNFWVYITQFFYPHAAGSSAIFCKKSLHKKINGFDEKIKLSEDMDYAKRASKHGNFRILKTVYNYTSVRRFDEEGRLKLMTKLVLAGIYRIIFGEIRTDIFKYRFGHKK